MFKWLGRAMALGFLFIFLSNYASCTKKEYLIPPKLATDTADVINTFHRFFYVSSEYFQKIFGNIDFGKFLEKQGASPPQNEEILKQNSSDIPQKQKKNQI